MKPMAAKARVTGETSIMQLKSRGTVKNLWSFTSILLMQIQIMVLMQTDVGLNVHFYILKLCTTTENERQSLHSESFKVLLLVKEKEWGNWFMCDELTREASYKFLTGSRSG